MRNQEVARQLQQIAALLAEQNVAFKPAAYRRAADAIEQLPQDIAEYPRDKAELKKLPGVGDAIAAKIIEYLETGHIAFLDKLMAEQGGIAAELMDIEGLGPKRVRLIQTTLGVKTVADLIAAAEAGKLRDLPRFDEILEKQILTNAKHVKERNTRLIRKDIEADVEALLIAVREIAAVERAEVAGSYRRRMETVGDIDIIVITEEPGAVSNAIASLPLVRNVAAHGAKKLSFDMQNGLRVDVRFVTKDQWGSALLYFTGDKDHNIAMRKIAMKKGWKLNEYGLFEQDRIVASEREEDIYLALELPFHLPTERTGVLKQS